MKITAEDLIRFGVIDEIVAEPVGGAHRDPAAAIAATGEAIGNALPPCRARPRYRTAPAPGEIPQYRQEFVSIAVC
jgi:acetyl-CoA carboxylase carboxyl transferase subunit alpha